MRVTNPVPRDWWKRPFWQTNPLAHLDVAPERVAAAVAVLRRELTNEWFETQSALQSGRQQLANALWPDCEDAALKVVYWAELMHVARASNMGDDKLRELLDDVKCEDTAAEVSIYRMLAEAGRNPRFIRTQRGGPRTPDLAVDAAPPFHVEVTNLRMMVGESARQELVHWIALHTLHQQMGFKIRITLSPDLAEYVAPLEDAAERSRVVRFLGERVAQLIRIHARPGVERAEFGLPGAATIEVRAEASGPHRLDVVDNDLQGHRWKIARILKRKAGARGQLRENGSVLVLRIDDAEITMDESRLAVLEHLEAYPHLSAVLVFHRTELFAHIDEHTLPVINTSAVVPAEALGWPALGAVLVRRLGSPY